MSAASYTTDLTLINNAEGGTWVEMTGWASGGVPQVNTIEWFIQGTGCVTAAMNNKTTIQSIAFNNGSDISGSFAAGDCFFMWQVCLAGVAADTFANGGLRAIIGSGQADFKAWKTGGDDFGRNPYGGWANVAVDPTFTADYTAGTPGAAYQYFGSGLLPDGGVSKGEMHCVDALRYGRGELIIEFGDLGNGYGTFVGVATQNDNISNRWGLFKLELGSLLWKGLMSLGNATNACDFRDSNRDIKIDDTPRTYTAFNRIEINNAASRVDWTGINFTPINAAQLSLGEFEMIDNATVNKITCIFTDMGTFIYQSNATLTTVTWRRCGQITHGGAVMSACVFDSYEGTANTSYLLYNVAADPDGELDGCSFTKGTAATHAIEFGITSPLTMTLRDCNFSGYNTANGQNDSTFHIKRTSGTVTINIIGGSGNVSYRTDGATVNIVQNPVTYQAEVLNEADNTVIEGAAVTVKAGATGPLPYQDSVTITRSGTTATVAHTGHGFSTGQKVWIDGADQNEYNRIKTITVTGVDSYTFEVSGTPATPATGTIVATAIIVDGETNASGIISDSRTYSADQTYEGVVQKGTGIIIFKARPVSGTINKDTGKSETILLTRD